MEVEKAYKGKELKMEELRQRVLSKGAHRAECIDTKDISTDASFRQLCESNACGNYGKCYMCPPDVGEIHELMDEIRTYDKALIYQTIGLLEDSYDFEGMMEAGQKHNDLAQQVREMTEEMEWADVLHLGAGGCRVCGICGKKVGESCRFPDKAMASLEAYGINVSQLASACGMNYINGKNTVTYFGAVFFRML